MGACRARRETIVVAMLMALVISSAGAAGGTGGPPAKGARWTWPKAAKVRVNISPAFSPFTGARQAVESAFRNWEAAGADDGNGSRVVFRFTYDEEPVVERNAIQVSYGRAVRRSQARTLLSSTSKGLFYASCIVDDRVTDPTALANAMAHEIGHTFGLAECDDCELGQSVMTRYSGDYNDASSGRNGPSAADNEAVRRNGGY